MRRIANVLGYSVCQVISCVITKQSLASSFYTFFLAFIYIFGGTAIPTKNINESTRWLFDISPYYYVFKGLAINEYENTENAAYLQKQNLTEEFLLKAHSNSLLEKNEQLLYNENGSRLLSLIQFLISGYDGIDVSNICSKEEYSETYLNAFSCTNIQDTFLKTEINNFCDDLDITFHKEDKTIFYIGCYFENEYQNENSIAELIDIYIKQMYEESKLFIFHYDWEEPITNQVDQFSYDQTTIYSWFFDFNKQMYFYSYCEEKNCLKPKIGIEIGDFSVFF